MQVSKKNVVMSLAVAGAVSTVGTHAVRAELTFYEDFKYTSGSVLNNQHNVSGTTDDVWTRAGTVAAASTKVGAGSLTSPVGASSGNKATITNPATASTERLNFSAFTSGSVFYSMTLNATVGAATVNNSNGAYFCGLTSLGDNDDIETASQPAITNTGARLALRLDPTDSTKLNLGLANVIAQDANSYASAKLTQGADVFVIVEYDINSGAADDVAKLWINPNIATFNPATTPVDKTVSNATPIISSDMIQASAFFLRQTGGLPQSVNVDEIRLGTSHFDVTPQTYYWDVNGTLSGAGGPTPDGDWDGVDNNFNTDSAGGVGHFEWNPHAWDKVVFSSGGGGTGAYTVTVSGTRSVAAINVEEGSVTIAGGAISTPSLDVALGASVRVQSSLSAPASIMTKSGAGTLEITKLPKNHAMTVAAGTVKVSASSPTFPGHPSGDDAAVSEPTSLSIVEGATLDLTNNDLIIRYGADTPYAGLSPVAALEALVAQGFGPNQDWTGKGITSSTAASEDAAGNFVIAIADNALLPQAFGVSNGGENFDGVDVPLESVLIKFTHRVDLNLDGLVNGDDVQLFATYYDNTLQHLPEPGSAIALLGVASLSLLRKRRRRRI